VDCVHWVTVPRCLQKAMKIVRDEDCIAEVGSFKLQFGRRNFHVSTNYENFKTAKHQRRENGGPYMPQIVYVLTNAEMPGLVKIGITDANVADRVKQFRQHIRPGAVRMFLCSGSGRCR